MEKIKQNPFVKKVGFNRIVLCCVLLLMYGLFCALTGGNFAGMNRIMSALNYAYFLGFLSLGVTFVIATGQIDFSIGPVMFCCALVSGYRLTTHGVSMQLHGYLCSYRSCIWYLQWMAGILFVSSSIHRIHGFHEYCKRYCFCIYKDTVSQLAAEQLIRKTDGSVNRISITDSR